MFAMQKKISGLGAVAELVTRTTWPPYKALLLLLSEET
jgi:hypothetical protein